MTTATLGMAKSTDLAPLNGENTSVLNNTRPAAVLVVLRGEVSPESLKE